MSSMAVRLRGLGAGRRRGDQYVLCPEDGTWFRPLYTDGMCPLCGEPIAEEPSLPLLMRLDSVLTGLVALGVVSVAMSAVVLYTYFSA